MAWFEFLGNNYPNKEKAFTDWHIVVCDAEGIPYPNQNAESATNDLAACWTDAYVDALLLTNGRLVMQLPDGDRHIDASLHATAPPTTVEMGGRGHPSTATPVIDNQPLPVNWDGVDVPRDPNNGRPPKP